MIPRSGFGELADQYFGSAKARKVARKTEWKYAADLAKLKDYCRRVEIKLARHFTQDDL